jgi:hypothetical protein
VAQLLSVRRHVDMSKPYQTEVWRTLLPDEWSATELDGQACVQMRRLAGVGVLEIIATDDDPAAWRQEGELYQGQLYGKTGFEFWHEFSVRWWTLLCGDVTLYVFYRCAARDSALERSDIETIVHSLLPTA